MAKKIDEKAAALAAAQGSGAVFQLDEEPVQASEPKQAPEPKHDDSGAKPTFASQAAEAAATINKTVKDTTRMNAQTFAPAIEAATEKMRGMMDVSKFDGKAVIERTQRLAQDAAELAKGNLEAMAASARIAAQNAGTIGQDAAEFGRKSLEGASEAMKSFAEAKSPVELMRLQAEYAKSYMETMIAEGTRMSETLVKLTNEALEPVQSRMAATAEKVKSIAS